MGWGGAYLIFVIYFTLANLFAKECSHSHLDSERMNVWCMCMHNVHVVNVTTIKFGHMLVRSAKRRRGKGLWGLSQGLTWDSVLAENDI